MKKLSLITTLLTVVFLATACQQTPITHLTGHTDDWVGLDGPSGPGLVADPESPIVDAPMPIGFKPIPYKCSVQTDGYYRIVNHVYQGKAPLAEAIQFAKTYMEDAGWRPIDRIDDLESNTSIINFRKGLEEMSLRIRRSFSITTIHITIQPRNTAAITAIQNQPPRVEPVAKPIPDPLPASVIGN